MKKIIVFLLTVSLSYMAFSQEISDKHLRKFGQNFAKAVLTGNPENCLPYFDKEYVKEQHDIMLKGNTMQFVSEFFIGEGNLYNLQNALAAPVFSLITSITFVDIFKDEYNTIMVGFDVVLNNGKTFRMMPVVKILSKKKFCFVGAMG